MTTLSYASYRQRATEGFQSLAATFLARRRAGDSPSSDEIKSLTLAVLNEVGATKSQQQEQGDHAEERWQFEAKQAALTRALEVVVEQSVENGKESLAGHLTDVLDIVLATAEDGYIDDTVPLTVLAGLLELRPVSECEPILGYIETRISRLTLGMEYQRGRGPILLRLLNDLLRRLPRSQSHSVILSGRILMLLSWVYPLNEKSGVNLRGNFNVGKGFSFSDGKPEEEGKDVTAQRGQVDDAQSGEASQKTEVEEGEEAEESKESGTFGGTADSAAFYGTFWSLQRYFINPPLLFQPPAASTSSTSTTPFSSLRDGVRATLLAFRAATKKAKDLSGSSAESSSSSSKARSAVSAGPDKSEGGRRRTVDEGGDADDDDDEDDDDKMESSEQAFEEYFFPKFLTSPDLLELELADPSFRRQILVQILILFQYLLGFSPSERLRTEKLPVTNMSAYPAYVLPSEVETWVRELRSRTLDELDAMEGGRKFRKAVQLVLQRDQNWIDWKLRSCTSFLLPPMDAAAQSEKARNKLRATMRKPKRYPYRLGNANLSRTWEKNLTSLDDLEPDIADDELSFILREYRLEKNRIKQQEAQLARAAPASPQRYEIERALEQRRTRLQALHWRAIRSASTQSLRFFSLIGAGNLEKLEQLVDEERRKREDEAEAAAEAARTAGEPEPRASAAPAVEYDSDTSVIKLTKVDTPEVPGGPDGQKEEGASSKGEIKADAGGEGGDEAGTPPPPSAVDAKPEGEKNDKDEPGTPPPPPAPSSAFKVIVDLTSPGTPKRPREEEAGDVAMQEGEAVPKRLKVE